MCYFENIEKENSGANTLTVGTEFKFAGNGLKMTKGKLLEKQESQIDALWIVENMATGEKMEIFPSLYKIFPIIVKKVKMSFFI